MSNQGINQYGQQQKNIMYNTSLALQEHYKQGAVSSSTSSTRKRITEKQPFPISYASNACDPQIIQSTIQQNSSKSSSSCKENHIFNSKVSSQIPQYNPNNPIQYQNAIQSAKGIQNKEMRVQGGSSISANLLKQQSSMLQQQNLHQPQIFLQQQQQQQSQLLQQNRKSSISNSNRPQKQSISIQNQPSFAQQEGIQSEERNYSSHIKKQSFQNGIKENSQQSVTQSGQIVVSNNSTKSQHNQNHQQTQSFAQPNYQIQNSQPFSNQSQINQPSKNITKDLINYKILQITSHNNNKLKNNVPQSNISSQISNQNQLNGGNNNNKMSQQQNSCSIGRPNSQQIIINSARRTESTSIQNNGREKVNIEQQKIQNFHDQDQSSITEKQKQNQQEECMNKSNVLQDYVIPKQINSQQLLQQYALMNSLIQNPNHITSIHNINNTNTNNVKNINNNNNNFPQSFNTQSSFQNNNHSLHERNSISQQAQQICNYNSNTLNPSQNPFLNNVTSNYSSFGTLPKGSSNNILKQQQILQNINQNNHNQQQIQKEQQINSYHNSQHHQTYSKDNELEISSVTNLVLNEHEKIKEFINNIGPTKNKQKSQQNFFVSHQNRLQTAQQSKNLVEQQNNAKEAQASSNKSPEIKLLIAEIQNKQNNNENQWKESENKQQGNQNKQQENQHNQQDSQKNKQQENHNRQILQQHNKQQGLQHQQSLEIQDDQDDEDDVPVVPHNHALMQQKYSKRVGISVSAVPDISKMSKQSGIKRVGIDMTIHKQMLEQKKNQMCSSNNSSTIKTNLNAQQPLQHSSQSSNVKANKSTNSLITNYQYIQKKLKSQTKEEISLKQNKDIESVKLHSTTTSQNVENNQVLNQIHSTAVENISSVNLLSNKCSENNQKSRLHQQKIQTLNQQNSQNQYYLVNPNQKPKNVTNSNQMVPISSQNSSQSQMNSIYNTQQSLQKEEELFTNKSERLAYNNYTNNGSIGNAVIQNEDKPGFQSERFNYMHANQILQNYNQNQKQIESTNKTQSHLKVAQQLVQQHLKMQNNIHSSQVNEQFQQNQMHVQKKVQEKQQQMQKQQQTNFIDNNTTNYYYPQVQSNLNDLQNSNLATSLVPQTISHNINQIHISNHNTAQQSSQSMNIGVTTVYGNHQSENNNNKNNINNSQNNSINIPFTQKQGSIVAQEQQKQQIATKVQGVQNTCNITKSHLKVNPQHPSTTTTTTTAMGSGNTKTTSTAAPSTSSVSSTQNLHQIQCNETMNNSSLLPNIPTHLHFSNQIGQMSINSNNSSKNRNGNTSISGNNTGANNAFHKNKNINSTAMKSETTQYSNFSSDSPLVCNENISGILTNRYEDNSQFKIYLSSKSNNVSSNNINPFQNIVNSGNQQPNIMNSAQAILIHRDQIPISQKQNYFSEPENQKNNEKNINQNVQLNENYKMTTFGEANHSISNQNNQGGQNSNSNSLSNNSQSNNDGCYKPSHKKNLSNHLINKFGAICKVATEGSYQFTQSSQNNSYNKENQSFNNQSNTNTVDDKSKLDTLVKEKVEFQVVKNNLKQIDQQIHKHQVDTINYQTNKSTNHLDSVCFDANEDKESMEQQLLNFSQRNIINEDIDYRIKDMINQEIDYLPNPEYFEDQPEINCMMRCILFDWMFEVCMELMLKRETLYLSLNYVDRFLSLQKVSKLNLQLTGAVSLFMACKIEEIYPPPIGEFAKCTDDGYTVNQIVEHELHMLKTFQWKLNPPTQIVWMNIYTEFWDRFIKISFEKPNKYQINFVQDQKLSNKNYLILFRIPDQKSFMMHRQMTQLLDLMQLDMNVLGFESRMLIASLMYLQLGIYYKQFTQKQIHAGFSEKYLFANSLNNYNEYFNSFLTQHFSFNLIDLLSSLQYVASFFDVEYNYNLSPAANIKDPMNNQISYEEYISFQTYFPNGIEYIRKRYCS